MKQVICIGSAAKDIFFPTSEMRIIDNPGDPEVKKLMAFEYGAKYQIDDRYEAPGGCAANSAQGLARLGIDAACYCRVGSDPEGDWVIDNLRQEKVETEFIQWDGKYRTDLSFILVNPQTGDRTIFFNRDANEKLEIKDDLEAEWLFVSALNGDWKGNMDKILTAKKSSNMKLAVNPGQANLKEDKAKVIEFIENAEMLLLNKDEAIEITGGKTEEPKELLRELLKLGPKIIAMTDGENGNHATDGEEIFRASATKEKPVDLTGAGDAFGAAFLAAILKDKDLSEALRWGTANGGSVVNYYGAKEGLLTEEKITKKARIVELERI
ncbi:MAG: carbohydrate kinase family protein [Candidatus Moranbacteria bacterium]|nr:carbohydrate kinase family protein [Candidatus Moranbacteria bacterium]